MSNNLEKMPLYYLRLIGDLFALNDPRTVKRIVNEEIKRRERPKYDTLTLKEMCEWGIITIREGAFLFTNNINNFRELLECNLDELDGITPYLKDRLENVRRTYDVSRIVDSDEELQIIDGPKNK